MKTGKGMSFKKGIFTVIFAPISVMFVHDNATGATQSVPAPFSKYGQIQGVQNYSSNPYWNNGSPYNQTLPVPVYTKGPDVNTGTCQNVVDTLVASYCSANNNCIGAKISDVRPNVMVQLSQLPGHNFATSCAGYIDSSFNTYIKKYGHISPTTNVAFPVAYEENNRLYQMTSGKTAGVSLTPKKSAYESGVAERAAELAQLHAASSNTTSPVMATSGFPQTVQDLTLTERIKLRQEGYAPFKDAKSYHTIKLGDEKEYKEDLKSQNLSVFCQRYPDDAACKTLGTEFSKAKNDANAKILEAQELIQKYGSKVTTAQKTAAEKALNELQSELTNSPNATQTATNAITEKTGNLTTTLIPFKKFEADDEAARQQAQQLLQQKLDEARELIRKINALLGCYSSSVTVDLTGERDALNEICNNPSSANVTKLQEAMDKLRAAAADLYTHHASVHNCPDYDGSNGNNTPTTPGGGGNQTIIINPTTPTSPITI